MPQTPNPAPAESATSQADPFTLGKLAIWRHPATTPTPIARVLLVHGISEHSGRHLPTLNALTAGGAEAIRFDLRGAGLSGGPRQYVDSFEEYVTDVGQVFNWIESNLPPLPLFVLGHSLGGAISIHFAARYGALFQGLILSAPAFRVGDAVSPLMVRVGRVLAKFLPGFRLFASDATALSRDPAVGQAYCNDPLANRFNTLRQGQEVLDALARIPALCGRIHNPVLIVHGTSDRVILAEGSFEIIKSLASPSKELHFLPGGYHEPHLDLDCRRYFSLVNHWIHKQLEAPAPSAASASRECLQ